MDLLKDRRTVLPIAGGAVALLAGLSIAGLLVVQHRGENAPPPPASRGGLVIDPNNPQDAHADPARPLRCFVGGQLVGEMTLADCARRNGVATDALDVGVDQTGALAAAPQAGPMITPLPPPAAKAEPAPVVEIPPAGPAALQGGPAAACWRYADSQWRRLPSDLPLGACVQALFAGRCERAGEAAYGRWAQQTLRLVPGRVEISGDNRSFRTLADAAACPPA